MMVGMFVSLPVHAGYRVVNLPINLASFEQKSPMRVDRTCLSIRSQDFRFTVVRVSRCPENNFYAKTISSVLKVLGRKITSVLSVTKTELVS